MVTFFVNRLFVLTFFLIIQNGTLLNFSPLSTCIFTTVSTENHQKRMAKKSVEKARKNRTAPAKTEFIEMAQQNRPTPTRNEQTGRGQALKNWFTSSFGRKARELSLFLFCQFWVKIIIIPISSAENRSNCVRYCYVNCRFWSRHQFLTIKLPMNEDLDYEFRW